MEDRLEAASSKEKKKKKKNGESSTKTITTAPDSASVANKPARPNAISR